MFDRFKKKEKPQREHEGDLFKKKEKPLREYVVEAVDLLVEKQVSETLILSSYKINTVFKTHFGVTFRVDRIGRALSRFAKKQKLERLSTNIPKYKLTVSKYRSSKKEETKAKKVTH